METDHTNATNVSFHSLRQAGSLKTHLKTHSGEKLNKCNLYASTLKTHINGKHNRERSHKCNQCEFASSFSSSLRTHSKKHSGEKPNKCSLCKYASYQAVHLKTHLKNHKTQWQKQRCLLATFIAYWEEKTNKAKYRQKNIHQIYTFITSQELRNCPV